MAKTPDNIRKDILVAANDCVNGAREEDYGTPEDNFATIAAMWNAYLHSVSRAALPHDITAMDVAAMMALLKIARIAGTGFKLDNWIDLAGYAACGGELQSNSVNK